MENINLVLDGILIAISLWTVFVVRKFGGLIGAALGYLTWGLVVLGIAHALETFTFEGLDWAVDMVEFSHRIIVLIGFLLLAVAFRKFQRTA